MGFPSKGTPKDKRLKSNKTASRSTGAVKSAGGRIPQAPARKGKSAVSGVRKR